MGKPPQNVEHHFALLFAAHDITYQSLKIGQQAHSPHISNILAFLFDSTFINGLLIATLYNSIASSSQTMH